MPTLDELAASEPKDDLAALAASEPQDDLASLAASEPTDTPTVPSLGVLPMPSKAAHRAALEAPPTARDTAQGAYTLGGPDPQLSAFQATRSGVSGDQAAQALKLSKQTDFAPEMVARNLDAIQQQVDQSGFEDGLGAAPVTAAYAAQSPIHAALVKDDVTTLQALEQGLLDLGYQAEATIQSYSPDAEGGATLRNIEAATGAFEKRPSGIISRGARDIPTLAAFYLAGAGGKLVGGEAGELGAQVGAMYVLNRGTLYRKIMAQQPFPETDEQGTIGQGAYDPVEYERKAQIYAGYGAAASATLSVGLSHAVGMALPSVVTRTTALSNSIIARAFTDEATRDVIGKIIGGVTEKEGVKVVTGVSGWSGHTLAGALAMAASAVADDATVQQALKGQIDPGKAAAVGWEVFKHSLVAAGVLSALPHVAPTVKAVGSAAFAPFDAARLDHNVEQVRTAKLTTRHPEEAERLIGRMTAQSDADTVYVSPEAMADPKIAAKVADAAGPHAMGDAQVTGGDVAVPTEKYLVRLNSDHETLRPDVKTIEDGDTPKTALEAAPWRDTLVGVMSEKSWLLQTEPDTPERAAKIAALYDRLRGAASRGEGMPQGLGRVATPEEVAAEMARFEQEQAATKAPPPPAYELPTPKITPDDHAMAREHIEGKTVGEIKPSYYETQGRRAADRAVKLATGPDTESERIFGKYAEALGVSLDSLRNAVQGTFSADTLPQARRKLRTAETEANRLEAGRMQTLTKLEGEHAMNVANRQLEIQKAVTQRKNAKVFADVAHEIRNELDRTEAKLVKKAGDADFLDKLIVHNGDGTIDRSYRDAHDAFMASAFTGHEPTPQPGALEPLLARLKRDALPVMFDEQSIRDQLADPKAWKDLTPAEARNFADAVTNIREAAAGVKQIELADRRATLREAVAQSQAELANVHDIQPLKYTADNPKPLLVKARGLLNDINAKLLQFKSNVEDLGATAKGILYDKMKDGMYLRDKLAKDVGTFYQDNWRKMPKEIRARAMEETDVSRSLPLPEGQAPLSAVPRVFLYMLRLHDGSSGNMDRVLGGKGWTQEVVDRVLYEDPKTRLTEPELDFLQSMHSYNDEKLWPLAKAKAERLVGVAPPKVSGSPRSVLFDDGTIKNYDGGYWPLRADRSVSVQRRFDEPGRGGIADFYGDNYDRATVYNQSMQKRAVTAEYPVDLSWRTVPGHISQVIHDLAMDEYVRNAAKYITDPEMKALGERKLGQGRFDEIGLQLQRIATRQADSVASEAGVIFRAMQYVRGTAIMGVVGDALPMALGQLSHIPGILTGGKVSFIHGTPALVTMFKPLGVDAEGMHFLPNWQNALNESGELQGRDMSSTRRIIESVANLPKATRPLEIIRTTAGIFLHLVDRYTSTWAYISSKNEGLAKGMSEPEAIKYANGVVQDIMPTHDIETAAPLLTNRTAGALLMMHGFGSTLYNLKYRSMVRPVSLELNRGNYGKALQLAAWKGGQHLAMGAVLSVVGQALFGHGREDDESTGAWAMRTAISSPFIEYPWLGGAGELAGAAITNATLEDASHKLPHFSMRQAPALSLIQRGYETLGKMANENRDTDQKFFDGLEMLLAASKVPSRPSRPARYAYDLSQGQLPEGPPRGPLDVVGGGVYGEPYHGARNPFTWLQDWISGEWH